MASVEIISGREDCRLPRRPHQISNSLGVCWNEDMKEEEGRVALDWPKSSPKIMVDFNEFQVCVKTQK